MSYQTHPTDVAAMPQIHQFRVQILDATLKAYLYKSLVHSRVQINHNVDSCDQNFRCNEHDNYKHVSHVPR
jgi:hypothetical protein